MTAEPNGRRAGSAAEGAAAWFRRHLLDDLLPRWLRAVDCPSGLFMPQLDRAWQPKERRHATLVSQSRLIYNFATGFRLTDDERYRLAVQRGADALLAHFSADEPGVWSWSVDESGSILDERRSAYGHAFVVFGLAHAFAATGDERYRARARATAHALRTRFRDAHGGLIPTLERDGSDAGATRSQNPVMHFFEALLALGHEGADEESLRHAAELAEWVIAKLVPPDGILPELYSDDWRPLGEAQGGRIDIGHQFEWAYLLSRAVEVGALSDAGTPAPWVGGGKGEGGLPIALGRAMIENGLRLGYDTASGGIWSPATPDGRILHRAKGWWEQCEAARALHRYATRHGDTECDGPLAATIALCRDRFVDGEHGGWFMRIEPDGTVPSTDKGNEWKVDYHVVGLCLEMGW